MFQRLYRQYKENRIWKKAHQLKAIIREFTLLTNCILCKHRANAIIGVISLRPNDDVLKKCAKYLCEYLEDKEIYITEYFTLRTFLYRPTENSILEIVDHIYAVRDALYKENLSLILEIFKKDSYWSKRHQQLQKYLERRVGVGVL